MSKFANFMKANKKVKENEFYAATKSLCNKEGNPILWEFRHITSKENEELREKCMKNVPVTGKPGMYRPELKTNEYIRKLIIASIVMPDLYDAGLQDSYGVKTPEDLLMEMVDNPGEYNNLSAYVQKLQGFDVSFEEKVEEAKN